MLHLSRKIPYSCFLIIPLLFTLTGCITIPPASYSYDQQVDRQFEPPPTLLKTHTYYYIGTSTEPDAIIAIDADWQVQHTSAVAKVYSGEVCLPKIKTFIK